MSRSASLEIPARASHADLMQWGRPPLGECIRLAGMRRGDSASLPFMAGDATAGSECELQTAVVGARRDVDLPRTLEGSHVVANLLRRAGKGDAPWPAVERVRQYLGTNPEGVWENSWVRFPRWRLGTYARQVLATDLRADRSDPGSPRRADTGRFLIRENGEEYLRIPMSYLLKLTLADAIAEPGVLPPALRTTGERLLAHFLSDNTSPETTSFHVVPLLPADGHGLALARETSRRFLLTHVLVMYANLRFGLAESGQMATAFFSPHPPVRQRLLNACVPDAFYRELFMNPCLSGWDRGEAKHQYMHLCHQVLSRSHLNAVAKLVDAGIVPRGLVLLPSTSNISLANNGTHVSLGSRRLTERRADVRSGFTRAHEKVLADLAVKIVEHFLPLFVGTYSADPYRIDFAEFHPERVLGFLPHELDYTHLRMLWWRWRRKAHNRFCGHAVTPFGLGSLDRLLATGLGLRGDLVADFRLVDYLVAVLSTETSPALDGFVGNTDRLRQDLADLGVFDARMSPYLPVRTREFDAVGFCGHEARYYSLFASLTGDLAPAVDLQTLVTALAYRYIADGTVTHDDIPDDPFTESERRQALFASAIGVDRVYIRRDTRNTFMRRIMAKVARVATSRRYAGYWKVAVQDYRRALLQVLREDAADLADALGVTACLDDLQQRLDDPGAAAVAGRLTRDVLATTGARSALRLPAAEFNAAAERYYRTTLCRRQVGEAIDLLRSDLGQASGRRLAACPEAAAAVARAAAGLSAPDALQHMRDSVATGSADLRTLQTLLVTILATEHVDAPATLTAARP